MNSRDAADESLTIDDGLEVLNNPRRRYVLYLLEQQPTGMSIGDLADRVAAWEQNTDVDSLTKQQRKRVYVSLYQTHIIKMDDLGVVDFDHDAGRVQLTPRAQDILTFLPPSGTDRPWVWYYFTLAVIGTVVHLATLLEISVFASISLDALALIVYMGFLVLVLLHYYDVRTSSPTFADLVEES